MVKIEYEDGCVGCPQGCIHCGREHMKIPHFICDKCDFEVDDLYETDEGQICIDCLIENFTRIDEDNYEKYI